MVQAAHAAFEAGTLSQVQCPTKNHLVLCSVTDEARLLLACEKLDRAGIRFVLFREPDMGGRATALCTEALNEERGRVMASFHLWEEDHAK
jgi:hypothetical protein